MQKVKLQLILLLAMG